MAFTPYHDVVATPNAALLQMITRLLANGWTVPDSGDGRSVFGTPGSGTYGGGTNIITDCSGSGTYVVGNLSNLYAWIRLRSPAGADAPEIVIQHANFNQGTHSFCVWMALNPGTGAWAGAASDNAGTPPDLWGPVVGNNQTMGTPSNATTLFYHTAGTITLDMMIGDASEGYAFYAATRTDTVKFLSGIFYDYCKNADPSDETPYVLWCPGSSTNHFESNSYLRDGRPYDNVPNPAMPFGGLLSKSVDRGDTTLKCKLASYHIPYPHYINGGFAMADVVNPYDGVSFDVLEGCIWAKANFYVNQSFPGAPGLMKGTSTLFVGMGPEGGVTDGDHNTGRTLIAQGSGRYWLVWDGTTAVGSDLTVNLIPYGTGAREETTLASNQGFVFTVEKLWDESVEETSLIVAGGATTYYYQRVWDSGSGGRWCYYEMTTVNPTPLSTETTPNWTGAISAPSVVSTRTA